MFHKLHLQMTAFCTMVTGGIFLLLASVCLFYAQGSIEGNDNSAFLRQLSAILIQLQEQDAISHQWLNQMQEKSQMTLFLYDNNSPLSYQDYHASRERDALREKAIQEARDGHQMDIFHANVQQVIDHVEFDFSSAAGEEYAASVGVVPREGKHMGFVILYSLEKRQREMSRLCLIVFLAGMAAIISLLIFSWFFTRRMIIPLEDSRKRQMQFIASASHELRAPLSVVRAGLESLKKTDSPEERDHFITYMEEESGRMQNLVSDMLLLANADSDHLPLHMENCQPEELLLNIYEKYESIARKKKISLSISLPEEIMPDCRCDREKILQAFSILLDNALSYTPSGGKVRLCLAAEKNTLRFSFSDTGCGIPEKERERIFNRFYRSDDAHADKAHFGLGLCIAKEILEGHRGSIRVEDSQMGGSCFVVELPLFNLA